MPKLFDYQVVALKKIIEEYLRSPSGGFLLADAPRLGKTYVALGFAKFVNKNTVAIVPASVVNYWKELSMRFRINIHVYSYDYFRKNHEAINETFDVFLLDEAHKVKNPRAKITKIVMNNSRSAFVLALTGTPFQNSPGELATLLRVVKKNAKIVDQAAVWVQRPWGMEYIWVNQLLPKLREILNRAGWYIRREIADINLQSTIIHRSVVEVNSKSIDVTIAEINAILDGIMRDLPELERERVQRIKEGLFDFEDLKILFAQTATIRKLLGITKVKEVFDYIVELIDDTKEQIIVFTHHDDVRFTLQKMLADTKLSFAVISGETPLNKRVEIVKSFQDGHLELLLLSTRAAGEGLTLNMAKHVVFAELDWNPAVIYQAENRVVAVGETDIKVAHYIITPHPLERRMVALINNKAKAIQQVYCDGVPVLKK